MIAGCAAVAYSLQCDFLVGLVLERLVVAVDALLLDFTIGFEGTDNVPVLAQAVVQTDHDLRLNPSRLRQFQDCGKHEFLAWLTDLVYAPGTFSKEVCQGFRIDGMMEQAR